MRIISLIASATEIVSALGFKDQLVGRSHECDFPADVVHLPPCSEPKIDIHAGSAEIDRQVKEVVQKSLSVYNVDADKLKSLKPDVIVTQDHCVVCAVSLQDVEKAVCDWLDAKPTIVSLRPNDMADIFNGIVQVGDALKAPQKAKELNHSLKNRMAEISKKAKQISTQPTVACIEWIEPLMVAGNWVPELCEMLDVKDLFGTPKEHSPYVEWENIVAQDPEYILIMPCGWDIKRTREEMHLLTQRPEWSQLKAVKNNHVYVTDGNQYFNRPGPRVVESLEIMAEILYTESIHFGHENIGWEKYYL